MFKRYEKIPTTLRFTFHTVNLKRHINNDFRISFSRGSYHGATDIIKPDENGVLKFEATYDTKCTLYLSKTDATTRPKKLKIILHRFSDPQNSKIYGKINIDVARYYGSTSVSYEDIEMESGRSITPILGISIIVQQSGQSVVGTIDSADKSFIDEENQKYALSEWDQTEVDNKPLPMVKHSDKKKKKHHKQNDETNDEAASKEKKEDKNVETKKKSKHKKDHKKSGEDSEGHGDEEDNQQEVPDIEVPEIDIPEIDITTDKKAGEKKPKKVRKKSSKKGLNELEDAKDDDEASPPPAKKEEEPKEKSSSKGKSSPKEKTAPIEKPKEKATKEGTPSNEKEVSKNEGKTDNQKPAEKEQPKAVPQTSPPPVKKIKLEAPDVGQLFKAVLARPWTNASKTIYLDAKKKIPVPAAIFPIFSVIQHTKIFIESAVEKEKFKEYLDVFFEEFEKAPLSGNVSSETRFITSLLLLLLFQQNGSQLGFAADRTHKFTTRMLLYFNDYARQVVTPLLINFEVLGNRFATARFEVDPLLEDFQQVLESIKNSLQFTPGINGYLIKQFMGMLDAKMLNKLLANPARFVFSKAITWNSFLTAFQSVEKLELPLLRQAVWSLVMAVNMTSDAEPGDEVRQTLCPTLDPKLLIYILKNYRPDEMMPTPINWKKVAASVGVEDVSGYEQLKPVNFDDFSEAGQNLKVQLWNHITVESNISKLYPYLLQYSVSQH